MFKRNKKRQVIVFRRRKIYEKRIYKEIKMFRILYIIDSLRAGGKERRCLSLIQKIAENNNYIIEFVILNSDIHYREVFDIEINCHIIDRKKYSKSGVVIKIFQIFNNFKPNILHAWDTLSTLYWVPLKLIFQTKLITSKITDSPPNYKKFSYFGFLSEICFKFSDIILSNSKAGLIAYKLSDEKTKVIYNGFDFLRLANLKSKNDQI